MQRCGPTARRASSSVRSTAKVYAASGLTLPASGPPTAITGDWGCLASSAVTLLAEGDASDAIYGNEDTITLAFDGPTDMGTSTGGAWRAVRHPHPVRPTRR